MEMNRRDFIGWSASAAATAALAAEDDKVFDGGFADVTPPGVPKRVHPLVPAGASSFAAFSRRCVGCQLCVAACPHRVLRPSMDPRRFSQVEMGFENGWCRPSCTACGAACPAGAIRAITPEEKLDHHIGRAVWHKDLCLAVQDGVTCSACQRHCPAKAIILMPIDPGDNGGPKAPVVDADVCVGCGACEHFCPARPLPAMTVEGHAVHRVVRPMGDDDALAEAKSLIESRGFACVLLKDGVIVARMKGRGVSPLLDLLDNAPDKLRGAWLVDRVIGRAAAAIAVMGGVARVHAMLAAEGAANIFAKKGIEFSADKTVPVILNRDKTGSCPMEAAVKKLSDPKAMLKAIRKRIAELRMEK